MIRLTLTENICFDDKCSEESEKHCVLTHVCDHHVVRVGVGHCGMMTYANVIITVHM